MTQEWHGDELIEKTKKDLLIGLDEAGRFAVDMIREVISVQYTDHPSSPYQPPLRRTGGLQSSVGYEIDATSDPSITVYVGGQGPCLEMGTRNMAPRPFLSPTIAAQADRIARIITGQERYAG